MRDCNVNLIPISVNIPVYNSKHYVEHSINSILSQSFHDFEIIIVDDGSTDGSWEILDRLAKKDHRIKLYRQLNSGVGAARNKAISESSGEYIIIMDADDISLPHRLKVQKKFLDEHPDIDAVGSQWEIIDETGKVIGIDTHPTDPKLVYSLMYSYYSLLNSTTMIRRDAIQSVNGYFEDKTGIAEDYDLFMRMQMNGARFINLPNVLFQWRMNPNSITHSKKIPQTRSVIKIRNAGFSSLLKSNPDLAKNIARSTVYTFPEGTWQDAKIKSLFPSESESLLFETWLKYYDCSSENELFKKIVLWFREPDSNNKLLQIALQRQQMPWLSYLVSVYQAFYEKNKPINKEHIIKIPSNKDILFSIFLPFLQSQDDLDQRLKQITRLCTKIDYNIEIIIFNLDYHEYNIHSFCKSAVNIKQIKEANHWKNALDIASGEYYIYLEEGFWLPPDISDIFSYYFIIMKKDIVYSVDEQIFNYILDDTGKSYKIQFDPKWSRLTLLGKRRIFLSGFIHHHSLLDEFDIPMSELGQAGGKAIALFLAYRFDFVITDSKLQHYLSEINLNKNPLEYFQNFMVQWYFDSALATLPAIGNWKYLSNRSIKQIADKLSNAWDNNQLFLHPRNTNQISNFFLEKVPLPVRWSLFRYLLYNRKYYIISNLYKQKKLLTVTIAAFFYFIFKLRSRFIFSK